MRHNQSIDFFSSPTSKFIGFSDIRQPYQDINNHDEDLYQDKRSTRKSSFHYHYQAIAPLGNDFFQQKLEECDEQSYCKQDILMKDLNIKNASNNNNYLNDDKLIGTCCSKNIEHQSFQQKSLINPQNKQEKMIEEFSTPKKKAEFIGYRKFYDSTSEKEKSYSRNNQKGLRRLSSLAFSIVSNSNATTYKQVAQKLLSRLNFDSVEMDDEQSRAEKSSMQNVKRRVYDSLNVLLALGVIKRVGNKITRQKQKKSLLSGQYPDIEKYNDLLVQYQQKALNIETKSQSEKQLKQKLKGFKRTIERNRKWASQENTISNIIRLPFLGFATVLEQEKKQCLDQEQIELKIRQMIKWIDMQKQNVQQKKKSVFKYRRVQSFNRQKQLALKLNERQNDQTVCINFAGYPQSYGDLDFFKILNKQKQQQQGIHSYQEISQMYDCQKKQQIFNLKSNYSIINSQSLNKINNQPHNKIYTKINNQIHNSQHPSHKNTRNHINNVIKNNKIKINLNQINQQQEYVDNDKIRNKNKHKDNYKHANKNKHTNKLSNQQQQQYQQYMQHQLSSYQCQQQQQDEEYEQSYIKNSMKSQSKQQLKNEQQMIQENENNSINNYVNNYVNNESNKNRINDQMNIIDQVFNNN